MTKYTITFYNDMGHLLIDSLPEDIPEHIQKFVYEKIKNKINFATDKTGYGAVYYVLKSGLNDKWIYESGNDTIIVKYKLDNFNPGTMIYT
jgi:hypothetical protein